VMSTRLKRMIEAGAHDKAEQEAASYIDTDIDTHTNTEWPLTNAQQTHGNFRSRSSLIGDERRWPDRRNQAMGVSSVVTGTGVRACQHAVGAERYRDISHLGRRVGVGSPCPVSDATANGTMAAHGTRSTSFIFAQPPGPVRGIASRDRRNCPLRDVGGQYYFDRQRRSSGRFKSPRVGGQSPRAGGRSSRSGERHSTTNRDFKGDPRPGESPKPSKRANPKGPK